jgi:two-component system, NarL family, sensor histidine kinase BarA
MDDCISKPVSEVQLAHLINRWASSGTMPDINLANSAALDQPHFTQLDANQTKVASAHEQLQEQSQKQLQEQNTPVDLALCLKLANRKPALARDMLTMMLQSLPTEKSEIQQAVDNNDLIKLTDLVHKLYGSSCYCGVPQLKETAGLLDKTLNKKNTANIHEPLTQDTLTKLNKAIDDILHWGQNRNLNEFFSLSTSEETVK